MHDATQKQSVTNFLDDDWSSPTELVHRYS
jgi:hypothetical protein